MRARGPSVAGGGWRRAWGERPGVAAARSSDSSRKRSIVLSAHYRLLLQWPHLAAEALTAVFLFMKEFTDYTAFYGRFPHLSTFILFFSHASQ